MTDPARRIPVVIIGAGPTGATAAIELGARGIECLVIDRWDDVYPQPRAVHLDDEVYRILERMGVAAEFAAVSRAAAGLRLVDRHLRVLSEFDRAGLSEVSGHPRANMFDQPELERILRAKLHAQETVSFRGGTLVTGIEQTSPGHVVVHCRDALTGATDQLAAEVVLGCDGANSVTRAAIGATMQDMGFEQRWLVVDVATSADLRQWDGVQQVCDSRRAATYMRIGDERYRWEIQLLSHETHQDFATTDVLLPLLEPWLHGVDPASIRVLRTADYTFGASIADRWRSGHVFLLGDAAHLTPPFIGQGMGAGVRDAANLAWKVAGFLSGELSAEVLDTYQVERAAHARAMIALARRVGVVMTGGGRAGDVLRSRLLPLLPRVPGIRHQVADSATPALTRSSLIHARRGESLAGRLCPNAWLGQESLEQSLGTRWALVTRDAPSPTDADALAARRCRVIVATATNGLGPWLADHGAAAALVRPDRTVMASSTDVTTVCAMLSSAAAPSASLG